MVTNPIPKSTALQKLWIGSATIYEYQEVTDPDTFQTTTKPVAIAQDEPCRLSYSTIPVTTVNGVAEVEQVIKLFIRPDLTIRAGSLIEITQHERTNKFRRASTPAVYTNHQEVVLELDEDV